ncbi:MAG: energy transducer TonB [bacterium]
MRRELLMSFTGHIALLLGVGVATKIAPRTREVRRPAVITVEILRSGIREKEERAEPATHLVQPAPKPTQTPKVEKKLAPKPKDRKDDGVIRREGLGVRVEGATVLGYNYYLQQMLKRIGENWEDPTYNQTRKKPAMVFFVIERDGRLTEVKLEKSSGDGIFDESCLRAVLVTGKLPPLPDEFTTQRLKIHLEFEK